MNSEWCGPFVLLAFLGICADTYTYHHWCATTPVRLCMWQIVGVCALGEDKSSSLGLTLET